MCNKFGGGIDFRILKKRILFNIQYLLSFLSLIPPVTQISANPERKKKKPNTEAQVYVHGRPLLGMALSNTKGTIMMTNIIKPGTNITKPTFLIGSIKT
jgi:hypothetical protein